MFSLCFADLAFFALLLRSYSFSFPHSDGDGEVDKIELQHALKRLLNITAKDLHPKDVRGLFEHLDADGSHGIDKQEFIQVFGMPSDRQDAQDSYDRRKKACGYGGSTNGTTADADEHETYYVFILT